MNDLLITCTRKYLFQIHVTSNVFFSKYNKQFLKIISRLFPLLPVNYCTKKETTGVDIFNVKKDLQGRGESTVSVMPPILFLLHPRNPV